jgi:hypothetical protein
MSIYTYVKTITTSPTPLWEDQANQGPQLVRSYVIQAGPSNSGDVYLGGASMTTANGSILPIGGERYKDEGWDRDISKWYIDGTTDDTVRVLTIAGG